MSLLEESFLENFIKESLNFNCKIAITTEALCKENLTELELIQLSKIINPKRQLSWLKGRFALKKLLGFNYETSQIFFPNPKISLTHSGDFALAILALDKEVNGVGMDFEKTRIMKTGIEKFFLREPEIFCLNSQKEEEKSDNLLRLWTIKEALFKADLNNTQTMLTNYFLEDIIQNAGIAHKIDSSQKFQFASLKRAQGFISIARTI